MGGKERRETRKGEEREGVKQEIGLAEYIHFQNLDLMGG